ncbi:MAG: helix-turn-helix transcriptional regulator [Bacteroidota bacterium]|nr:helix-turn-helix transcriptional regulator [Bacteroidota bacterium]
MKKSSLYKGCLEPIIMQLLKDNGRMYGFEITQKVKSITKGELTITEGALYPLLHRLEADGILEASTENIGNRIRKYYSLTRKGKKETAGSMKEIRSFVATLEIFFNPKLA